MRIRKAARAQIINYFMSASADDAHYCVHDQEFTVWRYTLLIVSGLIRLLANRLL